MFPSDTIEDLALQTMFPREIEDGYGNYNYEPDCGCPSWNRTGRCSGECENSRDVPHLLCVTVVRRAPRVRVQFGWPFPMPFPRFNREMEDMDLNTFLRVGLGITNIRPLTENGENPLNLQFDPPDYDDQGHMGYGDGGNGGNYMQPPPNFVEPYPNNFDVQPQVPDGMAPMIQQGNGNFGEVNNFQSECTCPSSSRTQWQPCTGMCRGLQNNFVNNNINNNNFVPTPDNDMPQQMNGPHGMMQPSTSNTRQFQMPASRTGLMHNQMVPPQQMPASRPIYVQKKSMSRKQMPGSQPLYMQNRSNAPKPLPLSHQLYAPNEPLTRKQDFFPRPLYSPNQTVMQPEFQEPGARPLYMPNQSLPLPDEPTTRPLYMPNQTHTLPDEPLSGPQFMANQAHRQQDMMLPCAGFSQTPMVPNFPVPTSAASSERKNEDDTEDNEDDNENIDDDTENNEDDTENNEDDTENNEDDTENNDDNENNDENGDTKENYEEYEVDDSDDESDKQEEDSSKTSSQECATNLVIVKNQSVSQQEVRVPSPVETQNQPVAQQEEPVPQTSFNENQSITQEEHASQSVIVEGHSVLEQGKPAESPVASQSQSVIQQQGRVSRPVCLPKKSMLHQDADDGNKRKIPTVHVSPISVQGKAQKRTYPQDLLRSKMMKSGEISRRNNTMMNNGNNYLFPTVNVLPLAMQAKLQSGNYSQDFLRSVMMPVYANPETSNVQTGETSNTSGSESDNHYQQHYSQVRRNDEMYDSEDESD